MHRTLEFLLHHGYILLLGWVFAEQIGLPVPSMPLLLAAGALAGTGHLNFFASLFYVIFAAVSADSIWYQLGRRKGIRILQLLCKISLEPDSCFLRDLRISRITADELKEKIDAGEELVIVDLRHSMDFEADPETIPGAFHMDSKELEEKNDRLPRDREIILYCT